MFFELEISKTLKSWAFFENSSFEKTIPHNKEIYLFKNLLNFGVFESCAMQNTKNVKRVSLHVTAQQIWLGLRV